MPVFTVCKFIKNTEGHDNKFPFVSRTLGKIVIPTLNDLSVDLNETFETFWVTEIKGETKPANKGVIIGRPLFPVKAVPLASEMFTVVVENHWVYLRLIESTLRVPYYIPHTIKDPFIDKKSGGSVICVPYTIEDIRCWEKNCL